MPADGTPDNRVPLDEVEFVPIRAQGPGGQNVNKVSSAVQMRFDVAASSLPERTKARLLALSDQRISSHGVIVIKAQSHRSLDANKLDALRRLRALIDSVSRIQRRRIPTRPSGASQRRRLDRKTQRGRIKTLRRKIDDD